MVTLAVLFIYIMLKGSIHQENFKNVNISASNIKIHKYIKQTIVELNRNKQQSNNSWRMQYPTLNNRSLRQRLNKETSDLNNTIGFFREGNGTPLQYSCLENPTDGGAWWAIVYGVAKSWTWLSDFTFTFHFHALEREMAYHSSVLAWRIPGQGSLVGCRLWGRTKSDTTEVT